MIESGCLELFTEFEGTEFIIERLFAGSVINHRVLFSDDVMSINIRAMEPTYMLKLSEKDIEKVSNNDKAF